MPYIIKEEIVCGNDSMKSKVMPTNNWINLSRQHDDNGNDYAVSIKNDQN